MWIPRLIPLLTPHSIYHGQDAQEAEDIRVHSPALLYSYYYSPLFYIYIFTTLVFLLFHVSIQLSSKNSTK